MQKLTDLPMGVVRPKSIIIFYRTINPIDMSSL